MEEILRGLLAGYDDVIYFAAPAAAGIVRVAADAVRASERGTDPALPARSAARRRLTSARS